MRASGAKNALKRMRAERPFLFAQVKHGQGVDEIIATIEDLGGLTA